MPHPDNPKANNPLPTNNVFFIVSPFAVANCKDSLPGFKVAGATGDTVVGQKEAESNDMETITARPNAKLCIGLMAAFAIVPIGCIVGIHASPPANPDNVLPLDLIMLGFLLILATFLGVQLPKHVRAEESGLHWQRDGHMAWDEIADFYISPIVQRNQPTPFVVMGVSGRKVLFYPDWTDAALLRDAVAARARNAKTDRWGVQGTRWVDEWPRTFAYPKPRDTRILYAVFGGLIALWVGYVLWNLITKLPRNIAEMGWGWGLSFGLVYLVVMMLPALKIGLILRLSGMRDGRTDETITIDKSGVVWQKPGARIAARWDEIIALNQYAAQIKTPARWVVQTANGTFEFGALIASLTILRDVLEENALDGVEWRDGDSEAEAIPGVRVVPRTAGATVHHVRTRTHRAMLGLLTMFALLIPIAPAVQFLIGLPVNTEPVFFTILVVCFFTSTVWAWLWFFRSRIEWDDAGITQYNTFNSRRILWGDTTRFYQGGAGDMGVCVLEGTSGKIRFYDGITDGKELIAQIERHRASRWCL